MTNLTPIADRLGKLLRLSASNRDGEVISAARGLIRTLTNAGTGIHALADLVERGAVNGGNFNSAKPSGRDIDWHAIARECLSARSASR